jgi:psp operon transcriptional activator
VAATNEHLPALVDRGRFRADLLDRLAFEVVTLPPLRARDGDIEVLADHFGRRMASEMEWPSWPGFSAQARTQLKSYDWPGNVRELRNVIERAVYRWEDPDTPVDAIEFDPFASPWRPRSFTRSIDNKDEDKAKAISRPRTPGRQQRMFWKWVIFAMRCWRTSASCSKPRWHRIVTISAQRQKL